MPDLGVAIAVSATGIATGLVLVEAMNRFGAVGAIAPAVLALGLVLLRYPTAALGLLVAGAILVESESQGFLPPVPTFYDVIAVKMTPQDMLLFAGLGGVLLRFVAEGERPRFPEPLTAPLLLLATAVFAGVVVGHYSHMVSVGELFHRSLTSGYIILIPLLAVNVVRGTRALKLFLAIGAGLAVFKGVSGIYSAFAGLGSTVESETISYLNPVPNLTMLIFVLGVVAALIRRVKLPGWMLAGAPIAFLALVVSYRRSFWIAGALTLIVVIIIASRHRGRTVLAIGAVALALAVVGAVAVGSSEDPQASPLVQRAQTLSPGSFGSNRGDRYRMDERKNVLRNIREHPLTGIGLGVPWDVHYPLAETHDRRYAHVAFLWFWLAFGPLGAIAYAFLLFSALWTAVRLWRRHPDPVVQVGAIAAFGGVLALAIVELTATFTSIEPRTSILLGAILGWLVAAWRDLPSKEDEEEQGANEALPALAA
ncbi:MAG TPA: O-antigen ligase family protein [Solirubrobacterales bacterium]